MPGSPTISTGQNSLSTHISTPDSLIFEGEVFAVSSFNDKGPFDVLPQHKNFISLIATLIRIRFKDGTQKEIPIERGVLRVYQNRADVYLIPQTSV